MNLKIAMGSSPRSPAEPIRSWLYLPVGQSDRPDSPHCADQAATVFSARTLEPS